MSKNKKIVILILIIVITMISIGVIWQVRDGKEQKNSTENMNNTNEIEVTNEEKIELVTDNALFYTIENCITKYEAYLNLDYKKQVDELNYPSLAAIYQISTLEEKNQALLDFLDKDYITSNQIDESNINEYIEETENEEMNITALKMNKLVNTAKGTNAYSVYAQKDNGNEKVDAFYIIKIDENSQAFSIVPIANGEYQDINEIDVKNSTTSIEKNSRNTIIESDMSEGQIATKYFQQYKNLLLTNAEEAYEKLDKEYREKRFGNIDEFQKYIESNMQEIQLSQIYEYTNESYDDYREYVAKDRYENLYIFDEISPNNYTVKLDTYTLTTDKFKEEYQKSNDIKKVQLQLDVFRQMINNYDFKTAYNVLAEDFKQNYYSSEEEFEEFVKQNMFRYNEIHFENIEKEGNVYACEVTFTDLSNGNYEDISKENINEYKWTFIVELNGAENFKLSFSIE